MKTERIFITGCGGMLGNAVYPYFRTWYNQVLATDKDVNEEWLEKLDVRDEAALQQVFTNFRPDVVLHLAAETDLEFCETHPDISTAVNDVATERIARLCAKHGSTMVYISTAGVFDGNKSGFYTEDDHPCPLMVYGDTKCAGEQHTKRLCPRSFVVRAGWMMGGGRRKEKKFIYKILQQIKDGSKEIFAVSDKWGTPTYTYDFAMNLFLLLATGRYGTYHMVCEGMGTRFDVAREILHVCERSDINLTPVNSDFFAKEYFAPRPFSEMMTNKNLFELGINCMRPWQDALRDYIENHFADYIRGGKAPSSPFRRHDHHTSSVPYDNERRQGQRNSYTATVEYNSVCGTRTSGTKRQACSKAIAINFSNSGVCLYMFEPPSKGTCLELTLHNNVGTPETKNATILWTQKEQNGLYKAGLMFQQ